MAKDTGQGGSRLEDLSDEEVERIEGAVFCLGGPPLALTTALLVRAGLSKPPRKGLRFSLR